MLTAGKRLSVVAEFVGRLVLASLAVAQSASQAPKIEGENLAGQKVTLPEAALGKVAVLIFGFSRASKGPTSAWTKRISADYASQPMFAFYQLPVLEDVPRFVRGMVISSMRKDVSADMRDHFIPILKGEAELKKLVGYGEPDDAYLVVLDRAGKVVGQRHGQFTDTSYSQLRAEVDSQLSHQK